MNTTLAGIYAGFDGGRGCTFSDGIPFGEAWVNPTQLPFEVHKWAQTFHPLEQFKSHLENLFFFSDFDCLTDKQVQYGAMPIKKNRMMH